MIEKYPQRFKTSLLNIIYKVCFVLFDFQFWGFTFNYFIYILVDNKKFIYCFFPNKLPCIEIINDSALLYFFDSGTSTNFPQNLYNLFLYHLCKMSFPIDLKKNVITNNLYCDEGIIFKSSVMIGRHEINYIRGGGGGGGFQRSINYHAVFATPISSPSLTFYQK